MGSYTFGTASHISAATAAGTDYTASYDTAGEIRCRAPTSATTCVRGSPTAATLT